MLNTGIFRNKWWMVLGAVLGLTLNSGVVQNFAFAVFIKPITEDLSISRSELTSAVAITALLGTVITPLFGKALDHFGLRSVHMPMIAAYAVATAGLAFLNTPYALLLVLFLFQHLFSPGQSPVAYSKAVAAWFDKDRGLALGIAIAGVGLGVAVIPPFANYLIVHYSWRAAYLGLGAAILVLALIPVALFEREPPIAPERWRAKSDDTIPGMSWTEAVRGWRFWAMTAAFFLAIVAVNGTLAQVVALLTDRGVALSVAVGALSLSGVGLTGGRILSGFFLDRLHGPYVACCFFVGAGIGVALLASGLQPFAGTFLCGLGIGAEVDLMAYFVSRYFGLRTFGAVYGTMFSLFSMGVGVGPFFMALSHDLLHSYVPMMIVFEGVLAVVCLLLVSLGPYRFAARAAEPPAGAAAAGSGVTP
ncbi:MAG TPA: MFS transporter [Stellaceae bacterium]|nr:MFS transporter [Stellaceae bacterium]